MLKKDGYQVCSCCNNCIDCDCRDFDNLFEGTDVIIAPIPFSKDSENVFLNDCSKIKIENLFSKMQENNIKIFIGGVISDKERELAAKLELGYSIFLSVNQLLF